MWMKVLAALAGAGLLALPVAGGSGAVFAANGGGSGAVTMSAPPTNITAAAAGTDAVQALGGGTVEGVTTGVSNGRAVYQVQILDQGLTWTIDVDMSGNVISEIVDNSASTTGSGSANASVTGNTQSTSNTGASVDGAATESSSEQPEVEGESQQAESESQQTETSDGQQGNSDQISGGASLQIGGSVDQSSQSSQSGDN